LFVTPLPLSLSLSLVAIPRTPASLTSLKNVACSLSQAMADGQNLFMAQIVAFAANGPKA